MVLRLHLVLLLLSFLAVPYIVSAQFIYVNASSKAVNPLGTASSPCPSLNCGLRLASEGSIILIAPGTYEGPANCNLCNSSALESTGCDNSVCPSVFTLQGTAGASSVVVKSTNINTNAINLIDKIASLSNITFVNFFIASSLTVSILENLKVSIKGASGGALTAYHSSVTLEHVNFVNNSASLGGGGLVVESELIVKNCVFQFNRGGLFGGALFTATSNTSISHSTFESNIATGSSNDEVDGSGGALYLLGNLVNKFTVKRSTFTSNIAGLSGGALYVRSSSVNENALTASHLVFEDNSVQGEGHCATVASCDASGGAMYLDVSSATISDSVFRNNSAQTSSANAVSTSPRV